MSGKITVRNMVGTITTTIDDNVTAADIIIMYAGGPETIRYLFNIEDMDVVVTVGDPAVQSQRDIQDVPEHYSEVHPVTVITIDKTGVTATKMQRKMRAQMRAVIGAAAHGSNYILKILRESSSNRRRGGILELVWETTYHIQYKDA